MQGESWVTTAEDGHKVVFECANGLFRRVVSVQVWRDELPLDVTCLKKLLNQFWTFVVEYLNFWV